METQPRVTTAPVPLNPAVSVPYPPSYMDRLMEAVERLPIPYWLTYLLLFLLQSGITLVLSWLDGWNPPFTVNPTVFVFALWLWGPLAIMTYLNSVSLTALSEFRPLLDLAPDALRRLQYEFTTMPPRGVWLNSIFWLVLYILTTYFLYDLVYVQNRIGGWLIAFAILQGLVSYAVGSAIYYHSVRQLRLVSRTVALAKQFDLFHLDPAYAFSALTARTGLAWILLLTLTMLTSPVAITTGPMLFTQVLQLILAFAAFLLPLRLVNQRLVQEKRRLLSEHDARLKAVLSHLHHSLDANVFADADALNKAILSLNTERDVLNKIPTWPWRPGLLTGFLSIAVLPIVLFLIQLAIERFLR